MASRVHYFTLGSAFAACGKRLSLCSGCTRVPQAVTCKPCRKAYSRRSLEDAWRQLARSLRRSSTPEEK